MIKSLIRKEERTRSHVKEDTRREIAEAVQTSERHDLAPVIENLSGGASGEGLSVTGDPIGRGDSESPNPDTGNQPGVLRVAPFEDSESPSKIEDGSVKGSMDSELRVRILEYHRKAKNCQEEAVNVASEASEKIAKLKIKEARNAWECGKFLLEMQNKMTSGFDKWRKSLAEEGFSARTSSRYLKLAKEIQNDEKFEELIREYPSLSQLYNHFQIIESKRKSPTQKLLSRLSRCADELGACESLGEDEINQCEELISVLQNFVESQRTKVSDEQKSIGHEATQGPAASGESSVESIAQQDVPIEGA